MKIVHHFKIVGGIYILVAIGLLITSSLLLVKVLNRKVPVVIHNPDTVSFQLKPIISEREWRYRLNEGKRPTDVYAPTPINNNRDKSQPQEPFGKQREISNTGKTQAPKLTERHFLWLVIRYRRNRIYVLPSVFDASIERTGENDVTIETSTKNDANKATVKPEVTVDSTANPDGNNETSTKSATITGNTLKAGEKIKQAQSDANIGTSPKPDANNETSTKSATITISENTPKSGEKIKPLQTNANIGTSPKPDAKPDDVPKFDAGGKEIMNSTLINATAMAKSRRKRSTNTGILRSTCDLHYDVHKGVSIIGIEIAIGQILSACLCFITDDTIQRRRFKFWAYCNLIFVVGVVGFTVVSMFFQTCLATPSVGFYWLAFCIMSTTNAATVTVLMVYLWFLIDTRLPKDGQPSLSEINLFRQSRNRPLPRVRNVYSYIK